MKNKQIEILLNIIPLIICAIGGMFVLSPIFLYWWIHGDYNRYLWIISKSYPYNNFGSGTFQLVLYGILFLIGILFFTTALALRKKYKK